MILFDAPCKLNYRVLHELFFRELIGLGLYRQHLVASTKPQSKEDSKDWKTLLCG